VLLLVLADHLKQIKTIFFNVNVDSVTSFVPCSKGPSCAIRVNRVVEISDLYNLFAKGVLSLVFLISEALYKASYDDHLKQTKNIFFNVNVDSVTSFVPCSKGPSCAIRVNTVVEI
jgi:hypothetical protein